MNKAFLTHLGWFTLGGLLSLSPQLIGSGPGTSGVETGTEHRAVLDEAPMSNTGNIPEASVAREDSINDNTLAKNSPELDDEQVRTSEKLAFAAEAPTIKRLIIASGVENREPIALAEGKIDEPVLAFLELQHQSEQASKVVVTFHHESGEKVGFIKLAVPGQSPRYRTWGRTRNIRTPGQWTAIVTTEEGTELARESFQIHS